MLTKQTGPSQVITLSATTQTVTVANDDGSPVRKVRIATHSTPALIANNTTTNLATAGMLIGANCSEHFSTEGSNKITILRGDATSSVATITPVA